MTLQQMLYFKVLAECCNMRQAAERLFISQPSLSIAIAKLETELGVYLLKRQGHRLSLTPEGESYLLHVKKILDEVEECSIHMGRLSDKRKTMIRLGCITPLLWDYFPRNMHQFLQLPGNGSIRFEFSIANTAELVRRLKNGLYDFLLCSENEDEELLQIPILSEPVLLIGATADPELGFLSWQELASLPLIGYEEDSVMDRFLQRLAEQQGVQLSFRYRAPTEDAIASLVEHGLGCAVISWSESLLKTFRIVRYPVPGGPYVRNMYLTTLKAEKPVGAAAQFIDFLKSHAERKKDYSISQNN